MPTPPLALSLAGLLLVPTTLAAATSQDSDQPASAAELTWLAGCWANDQGTECWLPPQQGMLLGLNRGEDGRSFEFLRIAEEENGLVYWASPGGRCPATPFTATELSQQRVVFTNPDHDFPQKLEYWLADDGTLHARVTADHEGEERGLELVWTRSDWQTLD